MRPIDSRRCRLARFGAAAGQGLVEYALIIALVSLVAIVALQTLGGKVSNTLNSAAGTLP